MDIQMLKRQHEEVLNLANYILEQINNKMVEKNINEIVVNINTISGKLKLHLMNEDKYIYPNLLNSENETLRQFGKKYNDEMKGVTKAFDDYKTNYNTVIKIKQDLEGFESSTKEIFTALFNRVKREEKELYPLMH